MITPETIPDDLRYKEYLFPRDAAKVFCWSVKSLQNMVSSGELVCGVHFFKMGRQTVYKRAALAKYIEGKYYALSERPGAQGVTERTFPLTPLEEKRAKKAAKQAL